MTSNRITTAFTLAALAIAGFAFNAAAQDAKPVKVFILAGQSNMEGNGIVEVPQRTIDGWKKQLTDEQIAAKLSGSLTYLARNPDKKDRYAHIVDKEGRWIVRDDVWVYYNRGSTGLKKGALTAGFGANDGKIGPEFGFGHVLGQAMNEPVLLIKTCWGGKSLAFDFRPPSAGKPGFEVKPRKDGTIPKPGEYYRLMMTQVREVLGNLKKYFPDYDGRGYEIAGFFWHQGWNDGCNQAFAEEYAKNMQWFIGDVRKDLGVKDLPFVIANSGFGGTAKAGGVVGRLQTWVQPAQKAAERMPHVICVDTRPFYRAPEQSPGGGDIEHWFSNAESYFLIGDASGKAMLQLLGAGAIAQDPAPVKRPNILMIIADDWVWPHAGAYGEPVIKTPVFDRVAREGVLFTQAYCAAPSCTPSRSAILTGQDIWRLGEGGQLFGTLPAEHLTYTDLLARAGYHVGYMAKGWAPGKDEAGGRTSNPAGTLHKSFEAFLATVPAGRPWCFWFGSRDPHRGYVKASGIKAGIDPSKVKLPACLPDTAEVRSDFCDYLFAIQRFDRQVGEILERIEKAGQLDNTLVVITSDNGMPFPRAKANLYDLGTRMPLAIRWPKRLPVTRVIDSFVNQIDLAPTFLDAAGLTPPAEMTGRSLLPLLQSSQSAADERERDAVVSARERHAWCRIDGMGYPARMIRTRDFLYIRNYEPERWPAGDWRVVTNEGPFGDVDASPTKTFMIENRAAHPQLFELAFGKRPREELYDCRIDPAQMRNLASDPGHATTLRELSDRLTIHLKKSGDPRENGGDLRWDAWPYYGRHNWEIKPSAKDSAQATAPINCPKTAKIIAAACQSIVGRIGTGAKGERPSLGGGIDSI